jgi:hypothetical protein
MNHDLKLIQPHYNAVDDGSKPFEVRKNDRPYAVGDTLTLHEYDPAAQEYVGPKIVREVTYKLDDPAYVKEGYVILGVK